MQGTSSQDQDVDTSTWATMTRKQSKQSVSPIWNYFEKCKDMFAHCLVCGFKYQHSNNTSYSDKETAME